MEATPCADCGTTGGYHNPGTYRPQRNSGALFGIEGTLCKNCYARRYRQVKLNATPRQNPKKPKELKPFVVDPASHVSLVWDVAREFEKKPFVKFSRVVDINDLVSAGKIGLIHACRKFDPKKGWKFSTYAQPSIERAIRRMLWSELGMVRIPEYLQKSMKKDAPAPKNAEHAACIADALAIRAKSVAYDGGLAEPLANIAISEGDRTLVQNEAAEEVEKILRGLPRREATVLRLRFGINTTPHLHKDISEAMGINRGTVATLERQALERARELRRTAC